jgi:hypothetical protein
MSILASFYLIDQPVLDQLVSNAEPVVVKKLFSKKIIDRYRELLQAHGAPLPDLDYHDYNGSVFLNVIHFLSERRGIDLNRSEFQAQAEEITRKRGVSTFLLTYAQRLQYDHQLNPDRFDVDELLAFNMEFDGSDERDFALAAQEAIKVLRNNLIAIPDEHHFLLFDLG